MQLTSDHSVLLLLYDQLSLPSRYVVVVEHDLSVLDYLSDFICCLYGVPGAYGVVTMPFSVREGVCTCTVTVTDESLCTSGINIFLDGYVPTENLRFRETSLVFKVAETADEVLYEAQLLVRDSVQVLICRRS